jgi:predicted branched-subunit amino acid permease
MSGGRLTKGQAWGRKLVALALIVALVPACQWSPAQIYIPLAYAVTGLCIALLMSPTPTAAVVGLVVGCLLGAAVYNNSLKHQILERQKTGPGN